MSRASFLASLRSVIITTPPKQQDWQAIAARIIAQEAKRAGIDPSDITGPSRARAAYLPRQRVALAMFDAGATQEAIGKALGRDRSSVYSMLKNCDKARNAIAPTAQTL